MKTLLIFFFCGILNFCLCQNKIENELENLKSSSYQIVYYAKQNLIKQNPKIIIPKLVELLKSDKYVKLENTADLIYPGAEKFYEHGSIVDYDIDWISQRAVWILEEITFQDFGFLNTEISEKELTDLHKSEYTKYLKDGYHKIDFKNKTQKERLLIYRQELAKNVENWWKENENSWTQYRALIDALTIKNNNINDITIEKAIHYLRFGENLIENLTLENYNQEIKPLLQIISNSISGEADQAKMQLDDDENYWLKIKRK